jgi:hypothetical protein
VSPAEARARPRATVARVGWSPLDAEELAALPWAEISALPPLVRSEDGSPAARATRVRLAAGAHALFVRFDCRDPQARATFTARDAPLWQEDAVEVFLAAGVADPETYIELEVNPLGALFDARVANPGGDRSALAVDTSWNWPGILWRSGRLAAREDWWAALALPWAGLGFATPPDAWRANFHRIDRLARHAGNERGDPIDECEFSAWSPTFFRPADFHRPKFFGHLTLAW